MRALGARFSPKLEAVVTDAEQSRRRPNVVARTAGVDGQIADAKNRFASMGTKSCVPGHNEQVLPVRQVGRRRRGARLLVGSRSSRR